MKGRNITVTMDTCTEQDNKQTFRSRPHYIVSVEDAGIMLVHSHITVSNRGRGGGQQLASVVDRGHS